MNFSTYKGLLIIRMSVIVLDDLRRELRNHFKIRKSQFSFWKIRGKSIFLIIINNLRMKNLSLKLICNYVFFGDFVIMSGSSKVK